MRLYQQSNLFRIILLISVSFFLLTPVLSAVCVPEQQTVSSLVENQVSHNHTTEKEGCCVNDIINQDCEQLESLQFSTVKPSKPISNTFQVILPEVIFPLVALSFKSVSLPNRLLIPTTSSLVSQKILLLI